MTNLNELGRNYRGTYQQLLDYLTETVKTSEEECILKVKDASRRVVKFTFSKNGDEYKLTMKNKNGEHNETGDIRFVNDMINSAIWGQCL